MIIKNAATPRRFLALGPDVLNDRRLSPAALGVLVYLLSKPPGWTPKIGELANRFNVSEYAIRQAMRELRAAGYAGLGPVRNDTGVVLGTGYTIHETPIDPDASKGAGEPCDERMEIGDGKAIDADSDADLNPSDLPAVADTENHRDDGFEHLGEGHRDCGLPRLADSTSRLNKRDRIYIPPLPPNRSDGGNSAAGDRQPFDGIAAPRSDQPPPVAAPTFQADDREAAVATGQREPDADPVDRELKPVDLPNDVEALWSRFLGLWRWQDGELREKARRRFARLSDADRLAALAGVKVYQAWCWRNEQRVVHASSFLRERRWETIRAETPAPQVFVLENTPAMSAWERHVGHKLPRTDHAGKRGWWRPTLWPLANAPNDSLAKTG